MSRYVCVPSSAHFERIASLVPGNTNRPFLLNSRCVRIRRLISKPALIFSLLLITGTTATANAGIADQAGRYLGWKEGTARLNSLVGVNTRRTSWCATFVRAMFERSGK